jgi:hypothetical protein
VQENVSVLIYNGLIQAVGQPDRMQIPQGVSQVDVSGKYLLPGFIDVRAYSANAAILRDLLSRGITTVVNPTSARIGDVDFRDAAGSSSMPGPRMLTSGPPLSGQSGSFPGAIQIRTEEEMTAAVQEQVDDADLISLVGGLPLELVRAAVFAAREDKVPVTADVTGTSWIILSRLGVDLVVRLVSGHPDLLPEAERDAYMRAVQAGDSGAILRWLELLDPAGPEVDDMLGALLGRDAAAAPLLVSTESLLFCGDPEYLSLVSEYGGNAEPRPASVCPPERSSPEYLARAGQAWRKALEVTRLLDQEEVRLVVGSDAPFTPLPPGASFHRELELLVEAGISPLDVIGMATRNAASALGILHRTGTIEAGKRADMILLSRNPLQDIRATQEVEWVMQDSNVFVPNDGDDG